MQNVDSLRLWAIVPTAGSGSRFSTSELKQYQYIFNKTVLQYSVEALYQLPLMGCMIVVSQHDEIAKTLSFKKPVQFCVGGKERMDSVLAGLLALEHQIRENDYIIVHDAARPCLHKEQIEKILNFCQSGQDAAIIATPVRDTLKKSDHKQHIIATINREQLWQAQTPQIVKFKLLKQALEFAKTHQKLVTDEASAVELLGEEIALIKGRMDNIKITYPEDLELAQFILSSRNNQK